MRLLVYLNPLCGLGHAAVIGGVLRGVWRADPEAAVVVVTGGPAIPEGLLPRDVDVVQLPAILPTRGLFSKPAPRGANLGLDEVRRMRRQLLSALLGSFVPDVVLVEHYPFGRFAFAAEIEHLLDEVAVRFPATRVVSSLSVLGARSPENLREDGVAATLRQRFDRVLVHTDPAWERIDDDYPRLARELAAQIRHTGYVLPRDGEPVEEREAIRSRLGVRGSDRLVVAQVGGGRDGATVLALALDAVRSLARRPLSPRVRLLAVAGSALPAEDYARLEARARRVRGAQLERHRPDLYACLRAADAAFSMTGYAAAAELLACGVPALMYPRRSDGEQVRRAQRLERLGAGSVLPEEVDGRAAAAALRDLLQRRASVVAEQVRLDGAATSATELLGLATRRPRRADAKGAR